MQNLNINLNEFKSSISQLIENVRVLKKELEEYKEYLNSNSDDSNFTKEKIQLREEIQVLKNELDAYLNDNLSNNDKLNNYYIDEEGNKVWY